MNTPSRERNLKGSASVQSACPPVLLVPGWSDGSRALSVCRDFLIHTGWPERLVHCMEFRDRFGSNVAHAEELAAAVADLCTVAAAQRIAVIAHSMGGLALRYYLLHGGDRVDTAVFVGTPHYGTWTAYLAWGRGGAEMRPGSSFLQELNAQPLPASVRAHCIRTPLDTRVVPGRSAWLPGATCHTVRLPTHPRMLRHRPTLRLIRRILLRRAPAIV